MASVLARDARHCHWLPQQERRPGERRSPEPVRLSGQVHRAAKVKQQVDLLGLVIRVEHPLYLEGLLKMPHRFAVGVDADSLFAAISL